MVTFPESPYDGQTIVDETGTNGAIVWTWSEENNEWTCKEYGSQGELLIYTDQVLVRDNTEKPGGSRVDPSELKTQKDVNHYLNDSEGGLSPDALDGYATEQWVEGKGYVTAGDVPSVEGYATEEWVESKGYVTASQVPSVDGYATQSWVEAKDYGTKSWSNGRFATQTALADLQNQINTLSGLVVQAHYSYGGGISTRPGEFITLKDDTNIQRFSACDTIRLDEVDAGNKKPALVRIIIGDTINVTDPNTGKFCQLKVTYSAGLMHQYTYEGGTLDSIPAIRFCFSGSVESYR